VRSYSSLLAFEKTMTIRLAIPDGASGIAEVYVAAWRAAYKGHMPDEFLSRLTVEQKATAWRRALQEPSPGTTVVWEQQQQIVGFCVYGPSRDTDAPVNTTGELVAINFHPDYWRRGLGTVMCRRVLDEGEKRSWKSLTLWVLKENLPARRFYERLGFVPDGMEKCDTKLIGAPLHEVRYRKWLEKTNG
jgi:RimJ/RimL family protein N-acetyltransferase